MAEIDLIEREEPREWLLVKRNLYERPDHIGYTGIRDKAGRFTEEDAKSSVGDGGYGVTMVRLADAPEFSSACYDDIARDHLRSIIAAKDAEIARLRGREEEYRRALDLCVPVLCGQNPILPPERVGCGRAILHEPDVFRCTDCGTPFHKECAKAHFGREHPDPTKQKVEDTSPDIGGGL